MIFRTENFAYSKGFPNILHQKLCNLLNDFCIDLYKLHNFWCKMFGKPFEYAKFLSRNIILEQI